MDRHSYGPYNHGSGQYHNGYQGNQPAENVNYGSTYQFYFGHPGAYNVSIDNNRLQQAPTYDQFSGAGRSYNGGPQPQPQPAYPPPYPGNPPYGSNAFCQPSLYGNQGTVFPLGNRPSMQSNQPVNQQNMFQHNGNPGFNNLNPSGQGNGVGGGNFSAPQYQPGNLNRQTESRSSCSDTDDDLSAAGSQESNIRRRHNQNCSGCPTYHGQVGNL